METENVNKWEGVCRLCLNHKDNLVKLFLPFDIKKQILSDLIHYVLDIKLTARDDLPDSVCKSCLGKVKFAVPFKKTIMASNSQLKEVSFQNTPLEAEENITMLSKEQHNESRKSNTKTTYYNKMKDKCRLCLKEECTNFSLFENAPAHDVTFNEIVSFTLGIKLTARDDLPDSVCKSCLGKVKFAVPFKKTIMASNSQLKEVSFQNTPLEAEENITMLSKEQHNESRKSNTKTTYYNKMKDKCRLCLKEECTNFSLFENAPAHDVTFNEIVSFTLGIKASEHEDFPKGICSLCAGKLYVLNEFKKQYLDSFRVLVLSSAPEIKAEEDIEVDINSDSGLPINNSEVLHKFEVCEDFSSNNITDSLINLLPVCEPQPIPSEIHQPSSTRHNPLEVEIQQSKHLVTLSYDHPLSMEFQSTDMDITISYNHPLSMELQSTDIDVELTARYVPKRKSKQIMVKEKKSEDGVEGKINSKLFIESCDLSINNCDIHVKLEACKDASSNNTTELVTDFMPNCKHQSIPRENHKQSIIRHNHSSKQLTNINFSHTLSKNLQSTGIDVQPSPNKVQRRKVKKVEFIQKEVPVTMDELPIWNKKNNSYQCGVCEKYFSEIVPATKHVKTHFKGDPIVLYKMKRNARKNCVEQDITQYYSCAFCPNVYKSKGSLSKHLVTHQKRKFSCHECSKTFFNKNTLQSHMTVHSNERPFACKFCPEKFKRQNTLRVHVNRHSGKPRYLCDKCPKLFFTHTSFRRHTLSHTGEKPYPCPICSRPFSLKINLVYHLRTHTGEKPYTCAHCLRSFSMKCSLGEHTKIHTGERPFSCGSCTKSFRSMSSLRKHEGGHMKADHKCSICFQSFPRINLLRSHKLVHLEGK